MEESEVSNQREIYTKSNQQFNNEIEEEGEEDPLKNVRI